MSKITTTLVWLIIAVGLTGLLFGNLTDSKLFFNSYKIIIELYLFGVTSYLVLKRIFFYRFKGNVDVIRLVKKSERIVPLFWQGLVLVIIYLVSNRFYYSTFLNVNTIMIAILFLYYAVQLILNSQPSIYIDEATFSYDDQFIQRWSWEDVKRIELENQFMRIISDDSEFELNFDFVDDIDYIRLSEEVDHNVLDGDFGSEENSKTLIEIVQNYAVRYNVRLVNASERTL